MTNSAEKVRVTYRLLIEHLRACPECETFPLCATGGGLYSQWRKARSHAWQGVTQADPGRLASDIDPPHMRVLPGDRQSASAAREFVREFLAHHVPGASEEYVDSVVLVTSELVTNAIRYGTEPGDSLAVVLDADAARTRIEVRDPVRRHPRRQPNSPHRERGRGLIVLDALCPGAWGVTDRPFGKAVYAEVQAPNATTRETGDATTLSPLTGERT